ncbi:hypothetical protein CYY_003405 [Polysphondylium violaceum]|uniref:Uncharacterized protein n=1 Tax=Polysphondylium violaceum TaxID=133409 RepID=A0A8J4PX13_9MYCE|nr:hypothetical protein CYY_003405 [Polysphondylium violaceum]
MTKKQSFKGPVTKWEKRWVTVGHMKLLKWVPLKTKRINQSVVVTRNKDGTTSRQTVAPNMETRLSRSKRAADRDRAKTDMSDEIQIMYLNSLPKTRRTVKKLDLLQKKQLQEAGIKDDDAAPSSADEKATPTRLQSRRAASNRNLKSPGIESNASDVDNDVADADAIEDTIIGEENGKLNGDQDIKDDNTLLNDGGKDDKDDDEIMDEEDDSKLEEEMDEDDKSDVEEEQDDKSDNDKSDNDDEQDDDDDEQDDEDDTNTNNIINPNLNDMEEEDKTTTNDDNTNPSADKIFDDSFSSGLTDGLNNNDNDTLFNNY